jgi:hypothetical protein
MARVQCLDMVFTGSPWVHAFILTCDNHLAVWFNHEVQHRKDNWRELYGGVPEDFVCVYPGTGKGDYEQAISWPVPGKYVRAKLWKIQPYVMQQPPLLPCGNCCTQCLNSLPNTIHLTISGSDTGNGSYPLLKGTGPPPLVPFGFFSESAIQVCSTLNGNPVGLICVSGGTNWALNINGITVDNPPILQGCAPFNVVYKGAINACPPGETLTFTL